MNRFLYAIGVGMVYAGVILTNTTAWVIGYERIEVMWEHKYNRLTKKNIADIFDSIRASSTIQKTKSTE